MSSVITVRLSEFRDAMQLVDIDNEVWNSTNSPGSLEPVSSEEFLHRNPPGSQFVAIDGERIVGYLGFCTPTAMKSNAHVLDIYIAIHPQWQRRHIGQTLMDRIKLHALALGKRKLSLRVLSSNDQALRFYQTCGFLEQGRLIEEFNVEGTYVDDILLYFPLVPAVSSR
ncbi:GNAT family N-acetyltransferase [Paenibacillus shirakamiensis]|nr:GNAT family N-acetyltransferase [Paenibacillus shirakamiensis]